MSEDTHAHIWKIAKDIGICMLASHEAGVMRARPMAAHVDADKREISFLTDAASHKDDEIAADPKVMLAFVDTKSQTYATINGTARISNDREKVRALWSTPAKAWWDDPEDPSIRVLVVTPEEGQYWDAPGTTVSMVKMALAAMSDSKPDLGENEKVSL